MEHTPGGHRLEYGAQSHFRPDETEHDAEPLLSLGWLPTVGYEFTGTRRKRPRCLDPSGSFLALHTPTGCMASISNSALD
jgi:hypothetical protein